MAIRIPIFTRYNDKGIRQAQKDFGLLGSGLKKLGGLVAGAFAVGQMAQFAKGAVSAAEAAQVANSRLENIANSMNLFGSQTGAVTDRLKAFAEQQMMVVGQDDELIKSTQAKLLTFKDLASTADEAGGAFDRATIAAFDLAAAGFGSAESNATQLGKALQDPIKGLASLRKAGVTFTDAERERIKTLVESNQIGEAQNMILAAIESQVGGTAEATVTATQKMKLAFGEMQESVGEALMPAFEELTKILMPLIDQIGPIISELFMALSPILTTLAEAISPLLEALSPLLDVFTALADIFNDALVLILPIFIELVDMLAPIVATLAEALMPIIEELLPVFVRLIESLLPFVEILIEQLDVFLIPVFEFLAQILAGSLIGLLETLTQILEFLAPIFQTVWNFAKPLFEGLGNLAKSTGGITGFLDSVYNGFLNLKNILGPLGVLLQPVLNLLGGVSKVMKPNLPDTSAGENARLARLNPNAVTATKSTGSFTPSVTKPAGSKGGKNAFTEAREKVRGYIKDTQKDIAKAMDGYNKAVAKANEDYAAEVEKANERFLKVEGELNKRRQEDLAEALRQQNEDRATILAEYAARAKEIIQSSLDRLRDAFKSATSFSLSDLFGAETVTKVITSVKQITDRIQTTTTSSVSQTVGRTATALVNGLRDKLNASKALLENASKLAAAGFSQTFIEQVVSSGTETGNALAQSILSGTPESQEELQKLFSELEQTSETGIDALAQTLYERNGLATSELKRLYEQNEIALTESLKATQRAYNKAVEDINASFSESLSEARTERDMAIAEADAALKKSLKDSAQALFDDLAQIEANFKEKIASMKGQLGGLNGTVDQVLNKIDGLQSDAKQAADTATEVISTTPTVAKVAGTAKPTASTTKTGGTTINVQVNANDRISGAKAGEAAVAAISKYVAKNGNAVGFITGGRAIV